MSQRREFGQVILGPVQTIREHKLLKGVSKITVDWFTGSMNTKHEVDVVVLLPSMVNQSQVSVLCSSTSWKLPAWQ
jgi:hypothetical protein